MITVCGCDGPKQPSFLIFSIAATFTIGATNSFPSNAMPSWHRFCGAGGAGAGELTQPAKPNPIANDTMTFREVTTDISMLKPFADQPECNGTLPLMQNQTGLGTVAEVAEYSQTAFLLTW
jgi:hypothetical protein